MNVQWSVKLCTSEFEVQPESEGRKTDKRAFVLPSAIPVSDRSR